MKSFLLISLTALASSWGTPRHSSYGQDQGRDRAAARSAPRFLEFPGQQVFTGDMIVRPRQMAKLRASGMTQELARQTLGMARQRVARFQVLEHVPQTDEYIIRLGQGMQEQSVADSLMRSGLFEYAEPDWLLAPTGSAAVAAAQQQGKRAQGQLPPGSSPIETTPPNCPDDPLFPSQWHHQAIRSCAAWRQHTGASSIGIGVCDTGILTTHEDLLAHRLEGYNAVDQLWESQGGDIGPRYFHGTRTTAVAAGNGNNGRGISGAGWNLSHRMLRVSNLSTGNAQLSDLQHAARTSIENGDRIANVSYHGASSFSNAATATYIKSIGGLMLWAAGNTSANISHADRDADDLIVVGASDQNDARAGFSAFGTFVDIFAPGTEITTATSSSDSAYVTTEGTSYATPLTAGVCAMIWSQNPNLSPSDVEQILKFSADDIGLPGVDDVFGYGRINLKKALNYVPSAAPLVSFSSAPARGQSPLDVDFRDQSVGLPSAWLWDFGDGTSSTLQNPSHVYLNSGDYTVSLTAFNELGSGNASVPSAILVDVIPPVAALSGFPLSGLSPLVVAFTDESSEGAASTWLWDFGDGLTSSVQNPSHTYTASGVYAVSLNVSNAYGSTMATYNSLITVDLIPPVAAYSATPVSGASPLVVDFSDESVGGVATSWVWAFGDGVSSTLQNPTHTYTVAGTYSTSLQASNSYGTDTLLQPGHISILPGPSILADFTGSPVTGTAPLQVDFTDLSIGNIIQWDWNFGDSLTSSLQHPSHIYTTPGEYDVNLSVSNALGKDSSLELKKFVVVQ